MSLASDRKHFIAAGYDREASSYGTHSGAQKGNLLRLLGLAETRIRQLDPRFIVDAGCGRGAAVEGLRDFGLLTKARYFGIDLSEGMIEKANQLYASDRISFAVQDAEAIGIADSSADLVLSIAMLHWLNQPKFGLAPNKAFSEIFRILQPGGLFAATIASEGMALRFRTVYHGVMSQYANAPGFDADHYVDDPLGCFALHDVVGYATKAGFSIEIAQAQYRPIAFPTLGAYMAYVRAYGYNTFMGPVPPPLREEAWDKLGEAYSQVVGEGPFIDELYTNYLLAWKK